jgi:hypothetical protein
MKLNEPEQINKKYDANDDPDFQAFAAAWIHLTPLQKKIILWRVYLESVRTRAACFIRSLLTH